MEDSRWLAERFEQDRAHLRAVAYRLLGSLSEADDAVQEAWLRLSRAGAGGVDNLTGWLTTVTGRVCLDMIRSRAARREQPLGVHVPDPVVSRDDAADPEYQALLADSVGLALLVVVQALAPAERLAFVLHDMFAVPFGQIAGILGRSPGAARLLASRARRRVQAAAATPDPDLARQRQAVDAFFAASRDGDFDALLAVLDPDVVLRIDTGAWLPAASMAVRGAPAVARQAARGLAGVVRVAELRPVLVNGAAGVVVTMRGQPMTVMGFTVADGKIAEIDAIADAERVRHIAAAVLTDE